MRIFVLGIGATGSRLVTLLQRQGHQVSCGDRDPVRARRFLGESSTLSVVPVNARDVWSIVRAARGSHVLVNCCPAVFNKIIMRAALRLRCHYLDTAAHLTGHPFRAEQLSFDDRFRLKRRLALVTAGVAPGLTNLLIAAAADQLDQVDDVQVRLYEQTDSDDPVSQWSAEESFDEATSAPRVYRRGTFALAPRFGDRESFRFPRPIGTVAVMLAAQDEVVTVPHFIALQSMDAKIGGPDMDQLRRWYRQGKLRKSRGLVEARFPRTPTPGTVKRLVAYGVLHNARFAAAVIVHGIRASRRTHIRYDVVVPSLALLRRRGIHSTPIAWSTAHMTALFIKHLPNRLSGAFPPEALPPATRRAILTDARRIGLRVTQRKARPTSGR
ncbi:MAG: saccharopine dehydrogenase NADP-binding domain-containing protein [Nitrospiraceae bacterium]|nr:saccharopine dehydrogenase NADP-binding domain-containing protein [Nitrospiraceae bacterium]